MNRLYFGDNLKWLSDRKEFPDASVDLVYLDPPFNSNADYNAVESHEKNPVMVAAGKKAAETRATGTYTYNDRLQGKPQNIIDLAQQIREFIMSLDTAIEEVPKKFYIACKTTQNIVCMEPQKQQIVLYLKLDPKTIPN